MQLNKGNSSFATFVQFSYICVDIRYGLCIYDFGKF